MVIGVVWYCGGKSGEVKAEYLLRRGEAYLELFYWGSREERKHMVGDDWVVRRVFV